MKGFCLTSDKADQFKNALVSGKINVEELIDASSSKRREVFKNFFGKDEIAKEVNALFESKLLLKNQKRGLVTWAKQVSGLKPEVRRDLMAKIERMDKVLGSREEGKFLEDLAEKRLGIEVTEKEAKRILELSNDVKKARELVDETSKDGSKSRYEYGLKFTMLRDYVIDLKLQKSSKALSYYLKNPQEAIFDMAGASKSMLSTLDNSFFGRQGKKVFYTNPSKWAKNYIKSWSDIGKELRGVDGMTPIKADIFSRQNALDGTYKRMKLDIGIDREEAFPSTLPERIPIIGRFFKGAETAFNGGALRMRADLADLYLKQAKEAGADLSDKEVLEGIGNIVNSMTGRGNIGKAEVLSKESNLLFFSVKFLKSNWDTLAGGVKNILKYPFKYKTMTWAEKKSAKNLTKIIGSVATVLATAEMLNPGSVEFDPRSTKFARLPIKVSEDKTIYIDITGGMSSLATLAARVVPTFHDGKLGFWTKNKKGEVISLISDKFGARTVMDVFNDFIQGKFSPPAALLRDIWKGKRFDGEKVTVGNAITGLTVPITPQQAARMYKEQFRGGWLAYMIFMELNGYNVSTFDDKEEKVEIKGRDIKRDTRSSSGRDTKRETTR